MSQPAYKIGTKLKYIFAQERNITVHIESITPITVKKKKEYIYNTSDGGSFTGEKLPLYLDLV